MKLPSKANALAVCLTLTISLLLVWSSTYAIRAEAASSSSITVSPTAGIVGSQISVSGTGFPPNANLALNWGTANVSLVLSGNPTQVTGISAIPTQEKLASILTDSSGSFSLVVTAPADDGGKHVIQVYAVNGTALPNPAIFTLEPSFSISTSSGPAGTPIVVNAHGLGDGTYSTNYHVMWDNKYFGYMTAVTTHGEANFTFYAVGTVGVHYVDIYQGYPGPGYLNPDQNPSSGNWYPPYLPYQTTFTITSQPFAPATSSAGGFSMFLSILGVSLVAAAFILTPIMAFSGRNNGKENWYRRAIGKLGIIVVIAALVIAGTGVFLVYHQDVSKGPNITSIASYVPQATEVEPLITVPTNNATSGPRISVSPNLATVGTSVTVTGDGFPANSIVPLSWSTRQGNNLNGFANVEKPLKNVTTNSAGSFTLAMQVPSDLEGIHYISDGNLTLNSNATLYIQRSASISPSEGPIGTVITIHLLGTGWDFNTNIVAIDYDNSFVGYACGFNSQGNITVVIPAAGLPGIHTIDLYPSIYLGPNAPATIDVYRYPLTTPYDHPELVPSFHFSFLITANTTSSVANSSNDIYALLPAVLSQMSIGGGALFLVTDVVWTSRKLAN